MSGKLLSVLRRMLKGDVDMDVKLFRSIIEDVNLPEDRVEGLLIRYRVKAEGVLKELLKVKPDDMLASTLLTKILEAGGRYREAEVEFKRAVASCLNVEDEAYIHYCYALFLERLGRIEEAKTEYLKAVELDHEEPIYLLEYANLLKDLGDRKAKKLYKRVISMLKPGDPLRNRLKEALKRGEDLRGLWTTPTTGALGRFTRSFGEELASVFERLPSDIKKLAGLRQESRYLKAAKETGDYVSALLEIDKVKGVVNTDDPEEWALLESLSVLNEWKTGFELHLNQLFFKERCKKCKHPQKLRLNCEKGLAECPMDPEYDEYVYEVVKSLVERLKAGTSPTQTLELQVPEKLRKIEEKFRESF